MIPISMIAPLQGWKQAQGAGGMQFVTHTFETDSSGALVHSTDGKLRAVVPPEGWKDYARQWPEAQPIIDQLTIRPAAAADSPAGLEDYPHQLIEQSIVPLE
ncbi:MAG: hypothetical protein F2774_06770 [Actinobacteria bacterium]|uniref:Unannotated protein n=1 Tax=freshwater metagenome TaxID=449393 RepID=A0A6J7BXU6_9ZZZZ|nr:hypothetical protein [Actinomycetota bacterium]